MSAERIGPATTSPLPEAIQTDTALVIAASFSDLPEVGDYLRTKAGNIVELRKQGMLVEERALTEDKQVIASFGEDFNTYYRILQEGNDSKDHSASILFATPRYCIGDRFDTPSSLGTIGGIDFRDSQLQKITFGKIFAGNNLQPLAPALSPVLTIKRDTALQSYDVQIMPENMTATTGPVTLPFSVTFYGIDKQDAAIDFPYKSDYYTFSLEETGNIVKATLRHARSGMEKVMQAPTHIDSTDMRDTIDFAQNLSPRGRQVLLGKRLERQIGSSLSYIRRGDDLVLSVAQKH